MTAVKETETATDDRLMEATLQRLEPHDWGAALAQFADGNFYQTHAYGSVSWGAKQLLHLLVREGGRLRAAAQVRVARVGPVWGVAYVRWGPCVHRWDGEWDGQAFRKALEVLREEFVRRCRWVVRVIPHLFCEDREAQSAVRVLQGLGFREHQTAGIYRTVRLDLSLPLEALRKQLDGKWRNQLNAAGRNGLEIQQGTGPDLFARFVALYDEMMARKRFETTVDVREFARIQEQLSPSEKMQIALAVRDGQLHAGLVATGVGHTGIYLLGATGEAGLKSKASYLLQWRMIEHLKATGCRLYDLGGINPQGNPGVYHFKSGMGGKEVRQLGRYELAPSRAHLKLLHLAESVRRFLKGLRAQ